MTVTIQNGQTLADIAIQQYGSLEAIILLAQTNNVNPTADLQPGSTLQCPEQVFDMEMQTYCYNNSVSPATAIGTVETDLRIFTEQFTEQFT